MNVVEAFEEVYTKFKLHFYREVFGRFSDREATLTTVETFCMEVIHAMQMPTVNEFASFINISPPNAAYKVNNLVKKGYLVRIPSEVDKREVYLKPTEKYENYFNISSKYEHAVWNRLEERLSDEELEALHRALVIMSSELMEEVPEYRKERAR